MNLQDFNAHAHNAGGWKPPGSAEPAVNPAMLAQQGLGLNPQARPQNGPTPQPGFHPSLGQTQQSAPIPRNGPTPSPAVHMLPRANHISPQTTPVPQQLANNAARLQMMQQMAAAQQSREGAGRVHPIMEREKFMTALKNVYSQPNVTQPTGALLLQGNIDLHNLHVKVIQKGGYESVIIDPYVQSCSSFSNSLNFFE